LLRVLCCCWAQQAEVASHLDSSDYDDPEVSHEDDLDELENYRRIMQGLEVCLLEALVWIMTLNGF
jgi:hypothetical protein